MTHPTRNHLGSLLVIGAGLAVLVASLASALEGGARRNLVEGGDFEKGDRRKGPAGWQRPDGLTSFWEKDDERHGRCIRVDTDVLNSQFLQREREMRAAFEAEKEPPPPPRKTPVSEDQKYATVAAKDGVHFATEKIPFQANRHYKLQVDVKADRKASPKVWVKAYARIRSRGGVRERIVWKKALDCVDADHEWSTFTTVFPRNTRIPERVEYVRIQLYPYWPRATYWFDNVRLFEIDEEEAEAYDVDRDRKKPAADTGRRRAAGRRGRAS